MKFRFMDIRKGKINNPIVDFEKMDGEYNSKEEPFETNIPISGIHPEKGVFRVRGWICASIFILKHLFLQNHLYFPYFSI